VEWLGEVPAHWCTRPIFALFSRRSERGHEDEALLSVYRDYGVVPREGRDDNNNRPSQDLSNYQLVKPGDLAINKMKTWQGSLAVSAYRGIVSPAYIICKPQHKEDNRYIHYLLRCPDYVVQYGRLSYGVRVAQWDMRFEDFRRVEVLLPPLAEQQAIARFLDERTAVIDELIAAKERLIALLGEKRAALITTAVTRGLDPAAPMKDSGVPWLGEIPAHWEVKQLKHIGQALTGLTYSPDDVVSEEEGTLVLRSSNVQDARIVLDDNVYVTKDIPQKLITRIDDILLCSRNGSRALIGKNALIDEYSEGSSFGAFMTVFRSDRNRFLFYVFNSRLFEFQSSSFLTSTINQLTLGNLNNMIVPLPSRREQEEIVEFLESLLSTFDNLLTEANRAIDILKEYRTALISAAVTGKIDVRAA
jgi:type I restriction enzyme S subunit